MGEKELRKKILFLTKEYASTVNVDKKFIPGSTQIQFAGRVFDEEEYINLVDAALDAWLTTGRFAEEFENSLAEFFGLKSCLLVNSGSSANLIALASLTSPKLKEKQIKRDDEVITVAAGFPTTVNAIIQNGLIPVFLDVDIGTYNIKVDLLKEAITDKTKAIMLAHTLGNPFDLDEVTRIVRKRALFLIEDTCNACGFTNGKKVGTFGDLTTVSFYPVHHITMGEGGTVVTNDFNLGRIERFFRDWEGHIGQDCKI